MIEELYYVYDIDLDFQDTWHDRGEAENAAQERAGSNGYPYAVMLKVPVGGSPMPELRAVTVYDEAGLEVFRSAAYDAELSPVE